MNVHLPFGLATVPVDVPDNWINGRCFRAFRFDAAGDERAEILAALEEPVGMRSIGAAAKGRSTCTIVVDPSYPQAFNEFVPALLEELEDAADLKASNITLLLANSLWSPLGKKEFEAIVPLAVRKHYRVELHDPFDASKNRNAGSVLDGIPLLLNKTYLDAQLKIVCGPVEPDMIHGYNGGRSLLLPGIAGEETLRRLYSFEHVGNPAATYGQLQNNPFHAAGMQASMAAGCDVNICLLLTPNRQISQVLVGDPGQTFLKAVQRVTEKMSVTIKEPMDIAVTCGGGAPFDGSLYQTINALAATEPILKPDGTIIMAAELVDGFGAEPLRRILLDAESSAGFERRHKDPKNFVPGQWIVQRLFRILEKHEVLLYTQGLSEDEIWAAGLTPVESAPTAVEIAMQEHGQRCKICALPDGPFSLASLASGTKM